ncbi:MAG: hypothetical protein HYT89_06775 [Candidatus Omnitrophica bacterium]|nr:hypothetical protein [Candidatus Omnitrophota bacterium]
MPIELKEKMDHFREINWSEVARQAIREKTVILEKLNKLFSKSKLGERDIEKYALVVKRGVVRKHKAV